MEEHRWLGALTVIALGVAIALESRLALPFIGMAALILYLRPSTKLMIALMFAASPFMYVYTYIQSLQGVGLTTSDVPVVYRAVKDVMVVLILARVGADQFLRAGARIRLSWCDICVLLFLLSTIATGIQSVVYGQTVAVAVLGLRSASLCVVAYYLARVYFASRTDYRQFARLLFGTGVAVALLGIIQFAAVRGGLAATAYGAAGEQTFARRVFSTMNDPNMFGMYLALCLLLARRELLGARRVWWFSGVAILAAGLVLSLSFSVLLPMLALLSIFTLTRVLRSPKLALGGFMLLVIALTAPGVADRLNEVGNLTDVSLRLKFIQMQMALDVFLGHPALGAGYGFVGQSRTWAVSDYEQESIAGENYYLILAAQSGIVGFGSLLAALGVWWWERGKTLRVVRDRHVRTFIHGVTAVAFVFWAANLVTDHYEGFPNNFFVWFLMGAVVVAGRIGRPSAAPEDAALPETPVPEPTGA